MKLRFLGISSSPQKGRATDTLVRHALEQAAEAAKREAPDAQVETQFVSLAAKRIGPCIDCGGCIRKGTLCILKDDWLAAVHPLLHPAPPDGLILGSPVYFHSVNAQMRAFMERFTCLFKQVWHESHPLPPADFSKTVAGAVSVGAHRHGGEEEAVNSCLSFLLSSGFLVAGSFDLAHGPVGYTGGAAWSGAPGVAETGIEQDENGMLAAAVLGGRVGRAAAWMRRGQ